MLGNCPISPPFGWGAQKPPPGVGIDWSHPLARGLRWFVPFNEGAGLTASDVVSALRGVLTNEPSWTGSRGVAFDGANDRVDFSPIFNPLGKAWTFACRATLTSSQVGYLFSINQAGNAAYAMVVAANIQSVGNVYVEAKNAGAAYTAGIFTLNAPASLTVTCDAPNTSGSNLRFYINGRPVSATIASSGATPAPAAGNWIVGGRSYDNTRNVPGIIEWTSLWDRVLSPSEVDLHTAQPYCMFESGWPVAGPSGSRPRIDGSLASGTQLLGAVV